MLRDLNLPVIDIHLVRDHHTGESKGYAFLEFRTKPDAEAALDTLNRALFAKRSLRASWASERKDNVEQQYSDVWADNYGSRR